MARRDWGVIQGETSEPGDHDSLSRAMAAGNRFDAGVIESVFDALVALDRFGGQLTIQVRRSKYDAEGQAIPQELHREIPGQWVTDGFIFSYESRDRTLTEIKAPEDAELETVDTHVRAEPEEQPVPEEVAA
jgi:hypothetical protein